MENIFGWIRRNPDITKNQKILLYITFGLIPAWIIGMALWFAFPSHSLESTLSVKSAEAFTGRIDSLYNDSDNHNFKTALLSTKFEFVLERAWENSFSVGDSVSKKKGSLVIEVFKKNKKMILNYKDVIKIQDF